LTHDYLVPSLQEWLILKQRETRRGRAELLLRERYSRWQIKEHNRHLPSLPEWLMIALYANKRKMSWGHYRMLYCSVLYYLFSSLLNLLVFFVVLAVAVVAYMAIRDSRTLLVFSQYSLALVILISLAIVIRRSNERHLTLRPNKDDKNPLF
jgi:hypothetical protein